MANGEQVREAAGTTSKKVADQKLTRRKAAVLEGRLEEEGTKRQPLFADYADVYLETYSKVNKKEQTHRRDRMRGLICKRADSLAKV